MPYALLPAPRVTQTKSLCPWRRLASWSRIPALCRRRRGGRFYLVDAGLGRKKKVKKRGADGHMEGCQNVMEID